MSEALEIEMDCIKCGRYSTSAICSACVGEEFGAAAESAAATTVTFVPETSTIEIIAPTQAALEAAQQSLTYHLTVIATQGMANAAVQGAGSLAGGQLRAVGFASKEGYITAVRNGVPAHTHRSYLDTLRSRYGLTSADLAALNLPGPMVQPDGPVSAGIVHIPNGPSIFERPASERAFIVGPKADATEAVPVVRLEHGTMIAGAIAEGHGVLVGWSGKGKLTRGALVAAIAEHDVKPPAATSARAQAGRVMSSLTGLGYVVRIARAGSVVANGTMWTVGKVNHRSLVGSELGSVEMRATLQADGQLVTEGHEGLGAKVAANYAALIADEIYQAGDVTSWLGGVLAVVYDAVRFGVGWYVPAKHASAAGALCATVSKIFGTDWIVPALPVATSDQLRDGIVRGLTSEVDALMARMATERATAKATRETALLTHDEDGIASACGGRNAALPSGDIGPKRAQTFLIELRAIGARIVAYGQVLGEERLACAKEQVRQAVIELETVLGDDYSGISARFAGVWDEIELDRKRAGGVL